MIDIKGKLVSVGDAVLAFAPGRKLERGVVIEVCDNLTVTISLSKQDNKLINCKSDWILKQ